MHLGSHSLQFVTQTLFVSKQGKYDSDACSSSRKVSRDWLATLQVNKRTNNTNNGP